MSENTWVCILCTRNLAIGFCRCENPQHVCDKCINVHFSKPSTVGHFLTPVKPDGPVHTQTIDTHQAAKQEIMKNIAEIDRCIQELTAEIERDIAALMEYRDNQLVKLNKLRAEFERNAQTAFSEVENSANSDPNKVLSPWAKDILSYSGDPETLKYFDFHVDVSWVKEILPEICNFSTRENQGEFVLPSINRNVVTLYDVKTQSNRTRTISRVFTDGIRLCFISKTELLIVGSNPSSTEAHTLNTIQGQLREIQLMRTKRILPGLIAVEDAAYVFGGDCVECEKYHFGQQRWQPLPNVAKMIHGFSPCRANNDIYIIETSCHNYQIFDLSTQEFRDLEIPMGNIWGNSISMLVDDEIYIVTSNKVGRLSIRESRFVVSPITGAGEDPISQCQPVLSAGEIYYVSWRTGNLNAYHIDAKFLVKKS